MLGNIGVSNGGEPLGIADTCNPPRSGLNPSIDQFRATLEVVDQFNKMAEQAAAAGAAAENAYGSVKKMTTVVGKKIGEVVGDLSAAGTKLRGELQWQDGADRLEKVVLAGVKGVMAFTYLSTVYIPVQVISLCAGVGVASIGMYEWSRGEGVDKIWQGLSLGASPSRLLVNLIKAAFTENQPVTDSSFKTTFDNVENVMNDIFKVDREKASLLEKGVLVLSKGFLLSGGVALAVPAGILSVIAGAASIPSGGWDRGIKIALLPAMTVGVLFKSIAIDTYVMGTGVLAWGVTNARSSRLSS